MTISEQIRVTVSKPHHKALLLRVRKMIGCNHTTANAHVLDLFLKQNPDYPNVKPIEEQD